MSGLNEFRMSIGQPIRLSVDIDDEEDNSIYAYVTIDYDDYKDLTMKGIQCLAEDRAKDLIISFADKIKNEREEAI